MNERRTTNILLLIIALPVFFYILKLLSFIIIPLIFSMFIALLFLPLMRWLTNKKVPKFISLLVVIMIIIGVLKIAGELVHYSSKELLAIDTTFVEKAEGKIVGLILSIEEYFGVERMQGKNILEHYFDKNDLTKHFGTTIEFLSNTLSMTLLTVFFLVLWLVESVNFQKVLYAVFKQKFASVKVFLKIEKNLIKFMKVKFIISLLTGIGITIASYFFDISFPVFWGLFAFVINFIQMIGSFLSIFILSLFAFVELDPTSTLLFFILTITLIQVLMGGIIEPIFMGKSFSINVITILVALGFWGYIWGIPGLIMAIPLTVFIKIILEQFTSTKVIANLISGSELIQYHSNKK